MRFKYLDHTSEAKFQAFGKTIEEVFANSGLAMMNLMTKVDKVKAKEKITIKIESKKLESLLFDFLDELIFIVDTKLIFISEFKNMKIEDNVLTCIAFGDKIANCVKGGDVKAPTYDEMLIEETDSGWMIQAVVDV